MRPGEKARAVNHVGAAVEQRRNHRGVVFRIVFEVRVLHEHVGICSGGETEPQRGALAAIDGVKETTNVRMLEFLQKFAGPVR